MYGKIVNTTMHCVRILGMTAILISDRTKVLLFIEAVGLKL